MGLREQLTADLREAMRTRNEHALSAIRMLRAAITNYEIASRGRKNRSIDEAVTDEELVGVVRKEIGEHRETLEFAEKAGRTELVAQEQAVLAVLERYLPPQLSREEIVAAVGQLIAEHGREFRRVMPAAAKSLRGRADLRLVNEVVRELTG